MKAESSLFAAMVAIHLAGCIAVDTPTWQSPLHRDHALAGKVWDVRAGKFVDGVVVEKSVRTAQFVILGETHDNVDHHVLQNRLLNSIVQSGRKPALVMEQFNAENQAGIDQALSQKTTVTAETVADGGKLAREGWKWPQHRPLMETALANNWPIVAGNLSRADARSVYAKGFTAIPATYQFATPTQAQFDATWNPRRERSMKAELNEGHCDQLPEAMAPGMMNAQRARDAVMAHAMLVHSDRGAVLIAGSGHGRRDYAVPVYLRAQRPAASIVSVAMVEVKNGFDLPGDYPSLKNENVSTEASNTGEPAFDFVWFTARASRKEPCESLDLSKLKAAGSQK